MDTKTVYKFAELEDDARQRAIDWYRDGTTEEWEPEYSDIEMIFAYLGIELDQQRVGLNGLAINYRPVIHYSIGDTQGDYATFEGEWHAEKMNYAGLLEAIPDDATLKRIGAELMVLMLRYPHASARWDADKRNALYLDWALTGRYDENGDDQMLPDEEECTLRDLGRSLARWLYLYLRDALEYETSEANAIEGIETMDYDFDENGRRV